MKKRLHRLFVISFFVLMWIPLFVMVLGYKSTTINENRALAPMPKVSDFMTSKYLFKLDRYLEDNFGLRAELLYLRERLSILVDGFNSENVLEGKDGWLFYRGENNILDYQNAEPFTQAQLNLWRDYLLAQRQKANAIGAEFFFVVTPNAHTIYGDLYLPDWVEKKNSQSRLDQLVAELLVENFKIIDPRALLLKMRAQYGLYFRTDSHWTDLGAYFGYVELMRQMGETPKDLSEFDSVDAFAESLDLAAMLGPIPKRDEFKKLMPKKGWTAVTNIKPKLSAQDDLVSVCESCGTKRAVIYRDSFMKAMQPFLSEHFNYAYYIWSYRPDWKTIEKEKPQIIIQQVVERVLFNLPPPRAE